MKKILNLVMLTMVGISTASLVYVVMFLHALQKGWLV
jgi:hypothetical protein